MTSLALRQLLLLPCVLLACTQSPDPSPDPSGDTQLSKPAGLSTFDWVLANMKNRRSHHTATLLLDGRILVAGGFEQTAVGEVIDSSRSTEIYDPATHEWSLMAEMKKYRFGHTATLLPNGKVLVVGGLADTSSITNTELYDPALNTWTVAAPLRNARAFHTATLLENGKVLVVGGANFNYFGASYPSVTELYDPSTNEWSAAGTLNTGRAFHATTRLSGGKVLVLGGFAQDDANTGINLRVEDIVMTSSIPVGYIRFTGSSELYDPASSTWTQRATAAQPRAAHSLTALPNGQVLVAGGFSSDGVSTTVTVKIRSMQADGVVSHASAELYNPTRDSWEDACPMKTSRAFHTATLLPDGKLFVTGGGSRDQSVASTELYDVNAHRDPCAGEWSPGMEMNYPRSLHTATLLPGGRVMLTGGFYRNREILGSALISAPVTGVWNKLNTRFEKASRHQATATLLPSGKLLVAGGQISGVPIDSALLYDPVTDTWEETAKLQEARYAHTATLLPDGQVLVVGGYDAKRRALGSAELYDPETKSWTATEALGDPRGEHTASLLPDGTVLVSGGAKTEDRQDLPTTTEQYHPSTKRWSVHGPAPLQKHVRHTTTPLPDGRLLIAGGSMGLLRDSVATLYDPRTHQEGETKPLNERRECHTATLLPNGKVLVVGGFGEAGKALSSAELYTYDSKGGVQWSKAGNMSVARGAHAATLLPSGQVLVTGGSSEDKDGLTLGSVEVYEPATNTWWSPTDLQMQAGHVEHTATVLPDGRLLVVGGNYDSMGLPEVYRTPVLDPTEPPLITALRTNMTPALMEPGVDLHLEGKHFRGVLEASSGTSGASAVDVPLLTLRSVESGLWTPLSTRAFSDNSADVTLPTLPVGHYVLNVTTRARTFGQVIRISNTVAPETRLDTHPLPETRETRASFSFSSPAVDLRTFQCRLDGKESSECPTGTFNTADGLNDGSHTFEVLAIDTADNRDATPVQYTWLVDTQAPTVGLLTVPDKRTQGDHASFTFSSNDEDVDSFECRLGDAQFSPCSSPVTYDDLGAGQRTFQVRARDRAGNVSSAPATYEWVVIRGYYGLSCAVSATSGLNGFWALLLLGLLKPLLRTSSPSSS
jgi:N-acetylneuraminic acid mutarotase